MTPDHYRECLSALGLSQRDLAPILGCADRLTRAWAIGCSDIPVGIAGGLEEWVAVRKACLDPLPPDDWHGSRSEPASRS